MKPSIGWNCFGDAGIVKPERLKPLLDEVEELIAIFVTMVKKVKNKMTIFILHPSSFILPPPDRRH